MSADRGQDVSRSPGPLVARGLAEQIAQTCIDGIFAFDADARLTLWNRTMERTYNRAAGEVLGKPLFEVFPFLEASEGGVVRQLLQGQMPPATGRAFPAAPQGRAGFYEAFYSPLQREDGSIGGGFALIRDVTERHRAEEQLEESEIRFRTMADGAPVLLWMAGKDALCTFFNQGWLNFTGRTLEMEYGNGWAGGLHPEDFQHAMCYYMNAFVERRDFRMEYRLRRADGQYRWILDTGLPRFASDGSFEGYIGSCIDITELREAASAMNKLNDELEVRVDQRTAELKHANAELEAFSYSVSHDLRAPLRAIDGFSRILTELHSKSLDEGGRHYLDRITGSAERMGELIDDLLNLARLTRAEFKPVRLDLSRIAGLVVEELAKADPARRVEVVIAPNLTATGDPGLLRVAIENLLGNAWKFTRNAAAARIEVGLGSSEGKPCFFVSDNGAGFDMTYSDRLFGAFQRLHGEREFEGTGIGLATVARVIHRHGGRIWARSKVDQGATFYFTLG